MVVECVKHHPIKRFKTIWALIPRDIHREESIPISVYRRGPGPEQAYIRIGPHEVCLLLQPFRQANIVAVQGSNEFATRMSDAMISRCSGPNILRECEATYPAVNILVPASNF